MKKEKCIIKWRQMTSLAKVPTKAPDAAGFDIYTTEDYVFMPPHSQHLFKTGLAYVIEGPYWLMAFDRGSTGSKGLHVHCGVCDKDYMGEIFICLNNDNPYPVIITKGVSEVFMEPINKEGFQGPAMFYPASKAIAQLIPIKMPEVKIMPIGVAEWDIAWEKSHRKDGKLGSSGK